MIEKELIKKINKLIDNYEFDEAEKIFDNLLKEDPYNIELWLRYAKMELVPPLVDEQKSIECLNRVLDIEKNNFEAILLLCCIHYYYLGGVDKRLFSMLESINVSDTEKLSMIEYIKSWRFDYRIKEESIMYENYLLKSIQLFDGHVWNYVNLGRLYIKQKKKIKGKELIKKALKNVQLIYPKKKVNKDYTDFQEYINEMIKGIHLTYIVYDGIEKDLIDC